MKRIKIVSFMLIALSICLSIICTDDITDLQYHIAQEFNISSPTWHPSDDVIVFYGYIEEDYSQEGIWAIDGNGDNPRYIFDPSTIDPDAYGGAAQLNWSDDEFIVFQSYDSEDKPLIYYIDYNNPSTATFIIEGRNPSIKGNLIGNYNIAYSYRETDEDYYSIYLTDINTSEPIELLSGDYNLRYPDWSPNGDQLVFVRSGFPVQENYAICIYDLNTEETTTIYEFDSNFGITYPQYTSDENYIGFVMYSDETYKREVFKISTSGGTPQRMTTFPYDPMMEVTGVSQFSWSPDNDRLVFTLEGLHELWMLEIK